MAGKVQKMEQMEEQMRFNEAAEKFAELLDKFDGFPKLFDSLLGVDADRRIRSISNHLNEFGYDEFGFDPIYLRNVLYLCAIFYKYWFRCEVHGISNIPPGRCLVVGNHSGQLPIDAMMIGGAMLLEADPPRMPRSMIEKWANSLPWVSIFMQRVGQIVGTPQNCLRLLEHEEAILVFPEGVTGINKLFHERYQLKEFGNGFMRLALETDTPVVPVALIGAEEQAPSFANFRPIAKMLGFPAFPITPTFPLFGPIGLIPYPTKYRIYFGEPLYFKGDPHEETEELANKVKTVKHTVQMLIRKGLEKRKHIFW
jgi:1-acyl-sn-glycerol-3-phosphate acyltransferase